MRSESRSIGILASSTFAIMSGTGAGTYGGKGSRSVLGLLRIPPPRRPLPSLLRDDEEEDGSAISEASAVGERPRFLLLPLSPLARRSNARGAIRGVVIIISLSSGGGCAVAIAIVIIVIIIMDSGGPRGMGHKRHILF